WQLHDLGGLRLRCLGHRWLRLWRLCHRWLWRCRRLRETRRADEEQQHCGTRDARAHGQVITASAKPRNAQVATNRVATWLRSRFALDRLDAPLQRAHELTRVVVVVPGHDRQVRLDREPAADRMDGALLLMPG